MLTAACGAGTGAWGVPGAGADFSLVPAIDRGHCWLDAWYIASSLQLRIGAYQIVYQYALHESSLTLS